MATDVKPPVQSAAKRDQCDELRIFAPQASGKYLQVSRSVAFPSLAADEIFEWVSRSQDRPETGWIKDLRRWVRETLGPRRQAGPAQPPEEP